MGRVFLIELEGSFYSCKFCKAHLALSGDLLSKDFQCSHGKAYLFENVVNVTVGEPAMRIMLTGHHIVSDIFCVGCNASVGWKYHTAFANDQKYKEGKFILERALMIGPNGVHPDGNGNQVARDGQPPEGSDGEDSEDV